MASEVLPEAQIRQALDAVLASETFASVARLSKFLTYVVNTTLDGRKDHIKEIAIAIDVYGRDAEFDPRTNPLVRVDASRLRRRLKEYYTEEGKADPLRIEVPKGTYVPRFIAASEPLDDTSSTPAQPPSAAFLTDLPSLAIFDFSTNDLQDQYLGIGFSEEIRFEIGRFVDLRIIPVHQMLIDSTNEVVREIKVDYMLSGSVIRSLDRIRVIAQLERVADRTQLWTERWERNLEPVILFELHREIAEQTVGNVASPYGVISRDRLNRSDRSAPHDMSAYELMVQFYRYARQELADINAKLLRGFGALVETQPEYAQGWAALSHLHLDRWRHGIDRDATEEEVLETSYECATRALSLDANNIRATVVQACIRAHERDLDAFIEKANRVMALNPYDSQAVGWMATMYSILGIWDTAQKYSEHSRRLNPHDTSLADVSDLNRVFQNQEYEKSWWIAEKFRHYDVPWAFFWVMVSAQKVGRSQYAKQVMRRFTEVHPGKDIQTEAQKFPFTDEAVAVFQSVFREIRNG